jgi:hypothetical protein
MKKHQQIKPVATIHLPTMYAIMPNEKLEEVHQVYCRKILSNEDAIFDGSHPDYDEGHLEAWYHRLKLIERELDTRDVEIHWHD